MPTSKSKRSSRSSSSSSSMLLLLGPYLVKLAKSSIARGDAVKALEHATQAVAFFSQEPSATCKQHKQQSIEVATSLQIVAEAHSMLGEHEQALEAVRRCLEWLLIQKKHHQDDQAVLLALAYGYMQLGDLLTITAGHRPSLGAYHSALEAEKQALGDMDPRVAETRRYLVELHLQEMELEEASQLCGELLEMHGLGRGGSEAEESNDRRLMALIHSGRGDHEAALEQLVQAFQNCDKDTLEGASIQACIGDTLAALGRDDQAQIAYEAALAAFTRNRASAAAAATVYLSLSQLQTRAGDVTRAKKDCSMALAIFQSLDDSAEREALASDMAAAYDALM